MKHLTLYPYKLSRNRRMPRQPIRDEGSTLTSRLQNASRRLAKSLLRQIRDFSNSLKESALREREIAARIAHSKDESFLRTHYLRGPLF